MRRALHCFIITLLCLTLGIDSAKACWFWRHRCRPTVARHAACPAGVSAGPCGQPHQTAVLHGAADTASCCRTLSSDVIGAPGADAAVVGDPCDCQVEYGSTAPADTAVEIVAESAAIVGAERLATETPAAKQAADVGNVVVHEPTVVVDADPARPTAAAPAAQDLLPVPQPAPTSVVTPASGERPAAEPPATAPDDKVPEQPVDKAVEPLAMPAAPAGDTEPTANGPVASAPVASLAVTPPPRPNLFDLYDDAADAAVAPETRPEPLDAPAPPATDSDDAAAAAEPDMKKQEAPTADADKPATAPEQPSAEPAQARPDEPAEETAAPESATDSTAQSVPNEPQRLWTDASGTHQARGWLVAVDVDHVRILKANGRHTTVAIDALSAADRDYVADVASRLAAARTAAPGAGETAGL